MKFSISCWNFLLIRTRLSSCSNSIWVKYFLCYAEIWYWWSDSVSYRFDSSKTAHFFKFNNDEMCNLHHRRSKLLICFPKLLGMVDVSYWLSIEYFQASSNLFFALSKNSFILVTYGNSLIYRGSSCCSFMLLFVKFFFLSFIARVYFILSFSIGTYLNILK